MIGLQRFRYIGSTSFSDAYYAGLMENGGRHCLERAIDRGIHWMAYFGPSRSVPVKIAANSDDSVPVQIVTLHFRRHFDKVMWRYQMTKGQQAVLGFRIPRRFHHIISPAQLDQAWLRRLEKAQPR